MENRPHTQPLAEGNLPMVGTLDPAIPKEKPDMCTKTFVQGCIIIIFQRKI